MARRRRTVLEVEEQPIQPSRPGGDKWELCVKAYMESLTLRNLSPYTKKFYKENFNTIHKLLSTLGCPTAPSKITTDDVKTMVLYMLETQKLSPITINHRIKATQQLFTFSNPRKLPDK